MPTRFHLHSSGAIRPLNNPAFDAGWEQIGQAIRLPMDVSVQRSVATALTDSGATTIVITTTQDILCYQFVSNQVFSPVLIDTSVLLSLVMRGLESLATGNSFLAYTLRAFSADGARNLGTLASSLTNAGTELGLTAATRIFSAVACAALAISEPWCLVFELGVHVESPLASTFTLRSGCSAATDFALTTDLATDLNPWCELSTNLQAGVIQNRMSAAVSSGMSRS